MKTNYKKKQTEGGQSLVEFALVLPLFIIVVMAVLFVSASDVDISNPDNTISWWVVVISGAGMGVFVFLLDYLTPKKKLSALAGVFFGLIVVHK